MAQVSFGAVLRELVPVARASVPAADVRSLLERLELLYPRLRFRIRDETGGVRRYMRVFVNGRDIAELGGLSTPLAEGDNIELLHSIQGG